MGPNLVKYFKTQLVNKKGSNIKFTERKIYNLMQKLAKYVEKVEQKVLDTVQT